MSCLNSTTFDIFLPISVEPVELNLGLVSVLEGTSDSQFNALIPMTIHCVIPLSLLVFILGLSINCTKSKYILEKSIFFFMLFAFGILAGSAIVGITLWHTFELIRIILCSDPPLFVKNALEPVESVKYVILGVSSLLSLLCFSNFYLRGILWTLMPVLNCLFSLGFALFDFYLLDLTGTENAKAPNQTLRNLNALPLYLVSFGFAISSISSALIVRKVDSYKEVGRPRRKRKVETRETSQRRVQLERRSSPFKDLELTDETYKPKIIDPTYQKEIKNTTKFTPSPFLTWDD